MRFPPAVETVVMRALSKEPSKRFPDVIAFASEFCQASATPALEEKHGFVSKLTSMFRKKD